MKARIPLPAPFLAHMQTALTVKHSCTKALETQHPGPHTGAHSLLMPPCRRGTSSGAVPRCTPAREACKGGEGWTKHVSPRKATTLMLAKTQTEASTHGQLTFHVLFDFLFFHLGTVQRTTVVAIP